MTDGPEPSPSSDGAEPGPEPTARRPSPPTEPAPTERAPGAEPEPPGAEHGRGPRTRGRRSRAGDGHRPRAARRRVEPPADRRQLRPPDPDLGRHAACVVLHRGGRAGHDRAARAGDLRARGRLDPHDAARHGAPARGRGRLLVRAARHPGRDRRPRGRDREPGDGGGASSAGSRPARPITVRAALQRSRAVFWRVLVAGVIVGIPVGIAQSLVNAVFEGLLGPETDISLVSSALVAGIVGAPLAYLLGGVVLGDVDPAEATRRSFRVFRARKLAAALVAIFQTIAVLLIVLGLGAGLDLALRVFDALGLGRRIRAGRADPRRHRDPRRRLRARDADLHRDGDLDRAAGRDVRRADPRDLRPGPRADPAATAIRTWPVRASAGSGG